MYEAWQIAIMGLGYVSLTLVIAFYVWMFLMWKKSKTNREFVITYATKIMNFATLIQESCREYIAIVELQEEIIQEEIK